MAGFSKDIDPKMMPQEPDSDGMVWYDASEPPFRLYGLYSSNPYLRLPESVAEATNSGVKRLNFHTAGGRVRFSTDSARIGVRVKMPYVTKFCHMALTGTSSFDVYADVGDGIGSKFAFVFKPSPSITDGFTLTQAIPACCRSGHYTVNFPLYNAVDRLEIGIDAGSTLGPGLEYLPIAPAVFYGSSITQGACATRPGLAYQSIISRRLNIDHINLGFSGSGRAEPAICEYMAGLDMSMFISDYDHNAPDAAYLRDTHYRLYSTIREKKPDLPIILVSKPDFYLNEKTGADRREVIEDTFRAARAAGDKNVWYIDGDGLCRGADEDSCTADGSHPTDLGFMKMADSIGRIMRRVLRGLL